MVRVSPSSGSPSRGAYTLREVYRSDALSGSLKAAFDRDRALPADMAQMLALLSQTER